MRYFIILSLLLCLGCSDGTRQGFVHKVPAVSVGDTVLFKDTKQYGIVTDLDYRDQHYSTWIADVLTANGTVTVDSRELEHQMKAPWCRDMILSKAPWCWNMPPKKPLPCSERQSDTER